MIATHVREVVRLLCIVLRHWVSARHRKSAFCLVMKSLLGIRDEIVAIEELMVDQCSPAFPELCQGLREVYDMKPTSTVSQR